MGQRYKGQLYKFSLKELQDRWMSSFEIASPLQYFQVLKPVTPIRSHLNPVYTFTLFLYNPIQHQFSPKLRVLPQIHFKLLYEFFTTHSNTIWVVHLCLHFITPVIFVDSNTTVRRLLYSSPLIFYYIQYFTCILRSNTAPSLVICYIPCQYSYPSYVHDLYPQVFLPSVHYAAVKIYTDPAFSCILFETVLKNTE